VPGDPGLPHRVTLGLNLLTHPVLYVAVLALGPSSVLPAELLVMGVEGAALAAWVPGATRPWGWAIAANLASWLLGVPLLEWLASVL
jgi:hypothetical protein